MAALAFEFITRVILAFSRSPRASSIYFLAYTGSYTSFMLIYSPLLLAVATL